MIRKIDLYIARQSLPALAFGALLYGFLGVVSTTIPRLQWVAGAPFLPLLAWLGLQLPTAIVQTLPMAVVLAILLGHGRLAADNELLAMHAGGIGPRRLVRVYVVIGVLCTALSLLINEYVLPVTHAQVATRYWQLTSGNSGLFRLAQQALAVDELTLSFASVDRATDEMRNVRIEQWEGRRLLVLFAESARFEANGLRLYGYSSAVVEFDALDREHGEVADAYADLVRARNSPASATASLLITTSETQEALIARYDQGGFEDPVSISGARAASQDASRSAPERRRMEILAHRKIAEPFGCVALLLLALPLATRYARSRGLAFGISLIVTMAWYLLLTFGQLLAQTGTVPVWLGLWLPNITLAAAGAAMQLRQQAG